jgi:geranylgeranyl diphosphate synthase, type I
LRTNLNDAVIPTPGDSGCCGRDRMKVDNLERGTSGVSVSLTERYAEAVETELRGWLKQRDPVGRHYDLLAYHMGWVDESLDERAGPRGKRFRPLLCLLSCEAVGGDWRRALPAAAAIEFLHNFSLIHDDIEDHDESRHHRPALWKLRGEPLAINAGDAMLALSGLAALSCPDALFIASSLQETALALTEGQYLDMTFESRSSVTAEQYFQMIGLKTGALITFSCVAGAVVGDGADDQVDALRSFGRHFGLAFQLFDDIRGIWAPSQQTGKIAAKDIVNRKKTLPVLMALERARGVTQEQLSSFYARTGDSDAGQICRIIDSLGVREAVNDILRQHLAHAFKALDGSALRQPFALELSRLASGLVEAG